MHSVGEGKRVDDLAWAGLETGGGGIGRPKDPGARIYGERLQTPSAWEASFNSEPRERFGALTQVSTSAFPWSPTLVPGQVAQFP